MYHPLLLFTDDRDSDPINVSLPSLMSLIETDCPVGPVSRTHYDLMSTAYGVV